MKTFFHRSTSIAVSAILLAIFLFACSDSSENSSSVNENTATDERTTFITNDIISEAQIHIEATTIAGEGESMQPPFMLLRDEAREFYSEHIELLNSIKELAPLPAQADHQSISIRVFDSEIIARNQDNKSVALSTQLQQQIELYFETIGPENRPEISIRNYNGRYPIISFDFLVSRMIMGVIYSPYYQNPNWEHIEGSWYAFSHPSLLSNPVIE